MTDSPARRILWWRVSTVIAAAAAAAFLVRRRPPANAAPVPVPPVAVPPPPPAPPKATKRDERTIDALIARETRRRPADFWLECTIIVLLGLFALPVFLMTRRGESALVLVRDLRQGDRIEADAVKNVRLPRLEHAFSNVKDTDVKTQVKGLVAIHDLQGGSVLRTTDVARPQALAITNIAAGEYLDSTKNIAFKPLPYVADAITPASATRKRATQFIAAGSVIRTDAVEALPAPNAAAAGDVEVPLRAFVGALTFTSGDDVTVVATPRGAGAAAVFEHVRVVSVDRARDPAILLVAMTKAEAMKLAALPPADFTLMQMPR